MNDPAIKDLLYRIADDLLIIGHRNSEWTGIGPVLEEDIAFSSMAQDQIGQSLALYNLLHELGESDPDTLGFMRNADAFRNCIFTELPNGEYDFSLVRHFLFDTAMMVRFKSLCLSRWKPLADLAVKVQAELVYHLLHANTLITKLGTGTPESISRLQRSIDYGLPYALGIFEATEYDDEIGRRQLCDFESVLQLRWQHRVEEIIGRTALVLPPWTSLLPVCGGRSGIHSEHMQPLIEEMTEVFRSDVDQEW